ncbi:MAG TPA: MerR family transcriptional regulator [Actinomycetales bacterium]|nr:MerR family transcriptional regulator [Actinomycetales bacterium]
MHSSGQQRDAREEGELQPTLKVAAVARRLGVAPATLRTWARRYGVGPPAHTAGAHRQYTVEDLARLLVMRRLTLEGVAPAEAARIALSSPVDAEQAAAALDLTGLPVQRDSRAMTLLAGGNEGPSAQEAQERQQQQRPGRWPEGGAAQLRAAHARGQDKAPTGRTADARKAEAHTGRDTLPTGPGLSGELDFLDPAARAFAEAGRALDSRTAMLRVSDHIASLGVVRTWEDVAVPVLRAAGEGWAARGDGSEVESLLTEALTAAFGTVTAQADEPAWGDALLACVQDEEHILPLRALQAALAERQVRANLLGAGLPHSALEAAVDRAKPKVLLLYALREVPSEQVERLPEVDRRTRLLVAGPGWDGVPLPLGAVHASSLGVAVDQIRLAVRH